MWRSCQEILKKSSKTWCLHVFIKKQWINQQPYYTYTTACEEMNYCVSCGVWQAALSPCNSYLLREAICSSERPPSSSFIINNLSLSSFGCTGKLLRKISVGTTHNKVTHTHTYINVQSWATLETISADSNSSHLRWKTPSAFWRQKGGVLNYLSLHKPMRARCMLICIVQNLNWWEFNFT